MLQRTQLTTLVDVFNQRAALTPQQIAFQYFNTSSLKWNSVTWQETFKKCIEYRNALASENLEPKSRILIIIENSIEWVGLEQASLALGYIPVAAAPTDSLQTLTHIIQDSKPGLIFIESDRLLQSLQLLDNHRFIVLRKLLPNSESINLSFWLEKNKKYPSQTKTDITADELATIIYTSGNSGNVKGVMLSHEAILNNTQACLEALPLLNNDKMLCLTPLSHIMGRVADYYLGVAAGITIVFNRGFGMTDESIKKLHPTLIICTPHVIEYLYKEVISSFPYLGKQIEKYFDYSNGIGSWKLSFLFWWWIKKSLRKHVKNNYLQSIRAIFVGGAALTPSTQRIAMLLDLPVYQGYGLTEAGGIVALNTPQCNLPGTVGKPLANTQITLDSEHQIVIKNNCLMLGYWNESLDNKINGSGWLETGDLGSEENGFISLNSRQSSIIQMSNGHCIMPEPLENKIKEDSIFTNVLLFGRNQEKLTAICEITPDKWSEFVNNYKLTSSINNLQIMTDPKTTGILFTRVNSRLKSVVGAPRIDYILPAFENWSEMGLINAQGKVNRQLIEEFYVLHLSKIYQRQFPFDRSQ